MSLGNLIFKFCASLWRLQDMPWSADFQARFGGDVGGSSAIRKFVQQNTHTEFQCSLQGFQLIFRQLQIYDLSLMKCHFATL